MRNVESNYVFVHKAKTSGFKWTFEQTGQPDQFYIVLADTELKGGVLTAHTTLPNDQRDTASIFLHVNKLRLDNAKWRFEKIA
jgi:predicted enzyme related to lactoylglutathione lyase